MFQTKSFFWFFYVPRNNHGKFSVRWQFYYPFTQFSKHMKCVSLTQMTGIPITHLHRNTLDDRWCHRGRILSVTGLANTKEANRCYVLILNCDLQVCLAGLVGWTSDSWLQGREFKTHVGHGVYLKKQTTVLYNTVATRHLWILNLS